MRTPHEIAELPLENIIHELRSVLPPRWKFVWEDAYAPIRAELLDMDTGTPVWFDMGVDLRLLLLSAYSWLWLQSQPSVKCGRWDYREDRDSRKSFDRMGVDPDPPDLDPIEVESVYSAM